MAIILSFLQHPFFYHHFILHAMYFHDDFGFTAEAILNFLFFP